MLNVLVDPVPSWALHANIPQVHSVAFAVVVRKIEHVAIRMPSQRNFMFFCDIFSSQIVL